MRNSLMFGALLLATPAFAATGPTLSSISHPPMQIGSANVVDGSGAVVGAVQRVEVTPEGKPTQVALAPVGNQDRLIVLNADTVRYDVTSNQIIADAGAVR